MSQADRDFSWLVETFFALGTSGVMADKFFTDDMTAQFSFKSPEVFTVGLFAIQHACARLEETQKMLVSIITKGVDVLYTHYFNVVLRMEEERIIEALKRHGVPPEIFIVPFGDAFEDWDVAESYLKIFATRNANSVDGPSYIIKVPWQQALSLVGSKKAIFLEKGMAYLDYTVAGEWMRERWKKGLQEWKEWDAINVVTPILEQARQQLDLDFPKKSWDSDDGRYYKLIGQTENDKIHAPLLERMFKDFFVPYLQTCVEPTDPSLHALVSVYRGVFKTLGSLEQKLSRSFKRRTSEEEGGEDEESFVPDSVGDGQIQFTGYEKIMPPCIKKIYQGAVTARTHLKYAERLKFFQWAYKAGIPLEVTLEAWGAMIDNDTNVGAQFRAQLINIPGEVYRREEKNKAEDKVFNYAGCAKMIEYCPFADIEDLVARKNECIYLCAEMPPSMAMVVNRRWSPMNATSYLKT